jgi:hypothetical protein
LTLLSLTQALLDALRAIVVDWKQDAAARMSIRCFAPVPALPGTLVALLMAFIAPGHASWAGLGAATSITLLFFDLNSGSFAAYAGSINKVL